MFGSRAGLTRHSERELRFSLGGFRSQVQVAELTFWLAKFTHSHPMMNDINTQSLQGLGAKGAAASHLAMERKDKNLKLGREPG